MIFPTCLWSTSARQACIHTTRTTEMATPLFFSTFEVTRQAFHRTALAYAIVNLKPIVPGRMSAAPLADIDPYSLNCSRLPTFSQTDVLVCPTRPAPRLTDLRADELAELMCAVQRVGRVVERAYKADGLTIACQVRCCYPGPSPSSFFLFRSLFYFFADT